MKRNFDIKQLMKQTKIYVPRNIDPQLMMAQRDRQSLENVKSYKHRQKMQFLHRPNSQGSIITESQEIKLLNPIQPKTQTNFHKSERIFTNDMHQKTSTIVNMRTQGQSQQSGRQQSVFTKNRQQLISQLKKGYALSQRAPKPNQRKNSIFSDKPQVISQQLIKPQTTIQSNNLDDRPVSPSAASSHRLNSYELREPKFYGKNGNELQSIQQRQFQLNLDDQQPKGVMKVSVEERIKLSAINHRNKLDLKSSPKNAQTSPMSGTNKNKSRQNNKLGSKTFSPDTDIILLQRGASQLSLNSQQSQKEQESIEKFIKENSQFIDKDPRATLEEYLAKYRDINDDSQMKNPKNMRAFLSSYVGNEVTEEKLDYFIQFLAKNDLPPFLSGYTIKDFLLLIIENRIDQVVFDSEMNAFAQNQNKMLSQMTSQTSLVLNSDLRTFYKKKKESESMKSLQDRIDSYRKQINENFYKYNFKSSTEEKEKIQRLKTEMKMDKQIYKNESEIIEEAARKFGILRKNNGNLLVLSPTAKNNQKGLLNKKALLFNSERPQKVIENAVKIETLMMRRIEEKQKAEKDIEELNSENFSNKWNSRKFYWNNNPQMKRSMSHLQLFKNNAIGQNIRKVD
ncbi:UNKNOWN [Stylonychia lemnae]|uniref:Uncharacterized protein n=1 Tax=Stylonychia lemnae TaxID=5949 RepID=A0A077ZZW8_STYLE|nr:UNKNOWN [Stylonychia lemnae]|eukprot:CDW74063.1 UNKNOWN [Stylonychia lemnae]